jgi:catechol 2,3-dioxygenase
MSMHIGHVALRTPEPERSARFLQRILGLRETHATKDEIFLSCNERHHEVEFLRGETTGIDHLGLEVDDESELNSLRDRLIAEGATIITETASEPGVASALRFVGPMGLVFEVYAGMERETLTVDHYMTLLGRRFGHVTFSTDDLAETIRFLCEVLGFRVSDTLDTLAWLRCDSDHHGIGLNETGSNSLHHYAFELQSLGAIGHYADHLALLGEPLVWGVGRHGPGRNLFTYVPDPCNVIVEAYSDLLRIEDEGSYAPIDWSDRGRAGLNLWGQLSPEGWRDYGCPILEPDRALADS